MRRHAHNRVTDPAVRHVRHHPSLPYAHIAEAMAAVRGSDADEAVKLLLVFHVLCVSRFREAAEARWSEIDIESRVWTLPPDRMKAGRQHRVPLSDQALDILARLKSLKGKQTLVFPVSSGPRAGRPVTSNMASRLLAPLDLFDENGARVGVHGFRWTFRAWALEQMDATHNVCGAALAHVQTGHITAAPEMPDHFAARVALMRAWADYVLPQ